MRLLLTLMLAAALAVAGCGGDEEEPAATEPVQTETEAPTEIATAPTETETTEPVEETAPEPEVTEPETSPEDQEGGAGDEIPAETLALFTGENGRITPRVVRVPAFIGVRVELRSADGAEYALRFGDEELRAGGALGSVSTRIAGLRPQESITGVPLGAGNRVRVEATAEPGP